MSKTRWGDGGEDIESQPVDVVDLLLVGLGFLRDVAKSAHSAINTLDNVLRAHANYRRDRAEFKLGVMEEIERL